MHSSFLSRIPSDHICRISFVWLILSKKPLMSRSTTWYRCCTWINLQHCAMAVSAERFGRNPLEFSLNFASQIGSMTCNIHCCTIRSEIAGIPSGLVSHYPLVFPHALLGEDGNYWISSLQGGHTHPRLICEISYCLLIYTRRFTSMVPFDSSVCQFNVFFTLNDCHEVIECFAIPAFRIQRIKDGFHAVVFRVSDFSLLLFSPLRSQHRHPLLSGWIFLVLLEAVFVVSWCYFHWIRLVAFPPPLTFHGFTGTTPLLSLKQRMVIALSRRYSHPPSHSLATG